MRSTKIAVLGAGFIGSALVRALVHAGVEVAVFDHNAPSKDLTGYASWTRGEFANLDAVAEALRGAEVAVHLISSTVPGDEHVEISRELSDNIFATLGFLGLCQRMHVPRVVFASSSSVYGVQHTIPTPETALTDPISSHGIQKLAIEKYLLLHRFHHGLDVRIARLSNPYGPGQKLYGRQGFISLTIGHLLKDEPILLRDDGRPIRDFIYIEDVAMALSALAMRASVPTIVNVGSGVGQSLHDVVKAIEQCVGRPIKAQWAEPRKADIPVSILDIALARNDIQFAPAVSFRDGLHLTLRHYGISVLRGIDEPV